VGRNRTARQRSGSTCRVSLMGTLCGPVEIAGARDFRPGLRQSSLSLPGGHRRFLQVLQTGRMSIREQSSGARAVLVGLTVVIVGTLWVLLDGGFWWLVAICGLVAGGFVRCLSPRSGT
jgi:hypothetical protein